MTITADARLTGNEGAELLQKLGGLPSEVSQKVLGGALRVAADVLAEEVKNSAPFTDRSGKLRRAIRGATRASTTFDIHPETGRRVRVRTRGGAARLLVGRQGRGRPFYAVFLEYGTNRLQGLRFVRNVVERIDLFPTVHREATRRFISLSTGV